MPSPNKMAAPVVAGALVAAALYTGAGVAQAKATSLWDREVTGTSVYNGETVTITTNVHLVSKPKCKDGVAAVKVNIANTTATGADPKTKYKFSGKIKQPVEVAGLCEAAADDVAVSAPFKLSLKKIDSQDVTLSLLIDFDAEGNATAVDATILGAIA